ncbi:carboxylesterase/lipase family protein [Phenylobacterium sp.]|uniref:carboxylesterase/lipase family protein n=1 Tax=Phenylobacterium sp. TaxID=1871053 RepID=UPI0035B3021A
MKAGAIFGAALGLAALAGAAAAAPVAVKVETGVLVGDATDKAVVFRDIPYAAPPVGELRWAPPAPAKPWSGEREAVTPGPSCPQPMRPDGKPNAGAANGPMSEDCLQLNVFAPPHATKAPVMVWLHGGAFRYGAGWIYDGANFARDGVVFVSINYRLGELGFFAHPALTKAAAPDAPLYNYGLMDQIAALKWVKRNIAAFGGDPDNVTVLGESAGAMSVLQLLAIPETKGLYAKAIVESGGGWFSPDSFADKENQGAELAGKLGLPGADASLADLRAAPVDKLLEAGGTGFIGPAPDGRLLKETATKAFAEGREIDVPMIIGSNSGEDSLMDAFGMDPVAPAAKAGPVVRQVYADDAAKGDAALGRALFTDWTMGAPARWVAKEASGGAPVWLYYFSYVGDRFRPQMTRAAHAAEIQYVFDWWGRRTDPASVTPRDHAVAGLMHSCWVAFAKTSTPTCASGPAWPTYDPSTDQLMEFGDDSGVRTGLRKPELDFQDRVAQYRIGLPSETSN